MRRRRYCPFCKKELTEPFITAVGILGIKRVIAWKCCGLPITKKMAVRTPEHGERLDIMVAPKRFDRTEANPENWTAFVTEFESRLNWICEHLTGKDRQIPPWYIAALRGVLLHHAAVMEAHLVYYTKQPRIPGDLFYAEYTKLFNDAFNAVMEDDAVRQGVTSVGD
jgi:hypothetical protein